MREHIEQLCRDNQIDCIVDLKRCRDSYSYREVDEMHIARVRGSITYATALHEMATSSADISGAARLWSGNAGHGVGRAKMHFSGRRLWSGTRCVRSLGMRRGPPSSIGSKKDLAIPWANVDDPLQQAEDGGPFRP